MQSFFLLILATVYAGVLYPYLYIPYSKNFMLRFTGILTMSLYHAAGGSVTTGFPRGTSDQDFL